MEEIQKQRRRRDRSAAFLPEDLIVWEILVRLPVKDLLRFRAVCRGWRHHTSAPDFLLAHRRHQPSLPLVSYRGTNLDAAFDTLDLRRCPVVVRQPVLRIKDNYRIRDRDRNDSANNFVVHSSCDGLVLLSLSNGRFYLCNPVTRQRTSLPRLRRATVTGMYSHGPSGEYRILYWKRARKSSVKVLTVGFSARPRCIGKPSVQIFLDLVGRWLISPYTYKVGPPVFLHGCLYWIRLWGPWVEVEGIVVFDTIKESFRLMQLPIPTHPKHYIPYNSSRYLHEIEGTLGISLRSENKIKVWVLQDHETEVWSLRYQNAQFRDDGCVRGWRRTEQLRSFELFHLGMKGKVMTERQPYAQHTGFWFKESLFRHAFLKRPRKYVTSKEPQLCWYVA